MFTVNTMRRSWLICVTCFFLCFHTLTCAFFLALSVAKNVNTWNCNTNIIIATLHWEYMSNILVSWWNFKCFFIFLSYLFSEAWLAFSIDCVFSLPNIDMCHAFSFGEWNPGLLTQIWKVLVVQRGGGIHVSLVRQFHWQNGRVKS